MSRGRSQGPRRGEVCAFVISPPFASNRLRHPSVERMRRIDWSVDRSWLEPVVAAVAPVAAQCLGHVTMRFIKGCQSHTKQTLIYLHMVVHPSNMPTCSHTREETLPQQTVPSIHRVHATHRNKSLGFGNRHKQTPIFIIYKKNCFRHQANVLFLWFRYSC